MATLRAKKVEMQTYVAELEVTPEEAEALTTDEEVDAYVDARGAWVTHDEVAELVEGWTVE